MYSDREILQRLNKIKTPSNLIYLCYRGSIAHNMYVPSTDPNSVDDIDLLGVYLSPASYYVGVSQHKLANPTTIEVMEEVDGMLLDCVFYEIRHFVKMALKCNPNIFSALWALPQHHLLMTPAYEKIYAVKDLCISRKSAYDAFTGYAKGQFKEMTHFNKGGYMGEKRKQLVSRFGFDVKNAAHLIRLLIMGIEVLQTGKMNVFRTNDRDMLLEIKVGKWPLQRVKDYSKELFEKAEDAYNLSTLREEPERDKVETVLEDVLTAYLCRGEV